MNIFIHELKAYRKSAIIWSVSLVVIAVLMLSMFPAINKDAVGFKKLLQVYPPAVTRAMGISVDSVTSFLGFYSSLTLLYVILCGAIQAMNLGTSIISKEANGKTADFLLTKPVKREAIITAKVLAAIVSLIYTNIIYISGASIMAKVVNTTSFNYKIFFMLSLTVFFVQLMFMFLGIVVSVIVPKIKSVLTVSLSTVFGFFFLDMFSSVIGVNNTRYIIPFRYYDSAYIIKNSAYEGKFIILEIMFIIVTLTVSYFLYSKKDIHVA
jgi:ABC-2 type transport system permease protein